MATTYRKSAKGIAEIETRANKLVPRLRSALILVDGKRSDVDLRSLILLQPDETLLALAAQGFIEVVSVTDTRPKMQPNLQATPQPAAQAATASAAASPKPATGLDDFVIFRREVVRMLNEQAGPSAEPMAIKLERTRSFDEIRPLLETTRQMIEIARGAQAAANFRTRFMGR